MDVYEHVCALHVVLLVLEVTWNCELDEAILVHGHRQTCNRKCPHKLQLHSENRRLNLDSPWFDAGGGQVSSVIRELGTSFNREPQAVVRADLEAFLQTGNDGILEADTDNGDFSATNRLW